VLLRKNYACPEESKQDTFVDRDWFLDAFADEVASGSYARLPYSNWKKLSKAKSPYLYIHVDSRITDFNITIQEAFLHDVYYPHETKDISARLGKFFTLGETLYANEFLTTGPDFVDFIFDYWGDYEPDFVKEKTLTDLLSDPARFISDDSIWNQPTTVSTINYYNYTNTEIAKEKKDMNTDKFFNFDFGPVSGSKFRLSPYGIAVATANNGWVAYNDKTQEFFNVEILNFDASKLIYKMPVAQNDIAIGDILIHSGKPVFVRSINKSSGTVSVVDYVSASVMDILPIKSPFGFNFYTKVCALMDFKKMNADADNPFGNILPFLMLSKDNQDFDPMILFFMNNNANFVKNPMMLYFLMSQKGNNDNMLPFLMMANGNNLFGAPEPKSNK
jgi:hypothetical protein